MAGAYICTIFPQKFQQALLEKQTEIPWYMNRSLAGKAKKKKKSRWCAHIHTRQIYTPVHLICY